MFNMTMTARTIGGGSEYVDFKSPVVPRIGEVLNIKKKNYMVNDVHHVIDRDKYSVWIWGSER